MKVFIITGPPYSGKGTQCELLESKLGYKHISTGDRCRAEKNAGTQIGRLMASYEEKGNYVPDGIMRDLFQQILEENQNEKGVILDGYPRTTPQVDDLIELTNLLGLNIEKILNIEVPAEELLQRAAERAKNSTREDDKEVATHIKRIRVFEELTLPAIQYMKSKLEVQSFSGMGSKEDISKEILKRLRP